MPDTLEHDIERYFDALAERVESSAALAVFVAPGTNRRPRWLAMAAACLVLVLGAASLAFWPTDDDVAPEPVLTDTTSEPAPTTAPEEEIEPGDDDTADSAFWTEPATDLSLWGPYEAVWMLSDFFALPTGGDRHADGPLVPLLIRPQTSEVTPIDSPPIGPREDPTVVWTGREVLVVGGGPAAEPRAAAYGADEPLGAAYDPLGETWRAIDVPLAVLTNRTIMPFDDGVWNGSELVFWTIGWAYDPTADTWRQTATSPLESRADTASVAVGSDVLVWGGCEPAGTDCHADPDTWSSDGAIWSAATDEWTPLPSGPLDAAPGAIAVADATGATIVGLHMLDDADGRNLVARYEPGVGWIDLPDPPAAPWIGSDLTQVGRSVVLSGWAYDAVQYVALHAGADEWVELPSAGASADHSLADGWGHLLVIRGREASGPSQEQVLAISEPWLPVEPESIDVEIRVDMSEGVPFAVRSFSELPPGAVYSSLWYDGRLKSRASAGIGSTGGSRLPADPGDYPLEAQIVVEDIDMYPIAATDPVQLTLP